MKIKFFLAGSFLFFSLGGCQPHSPAPSSASEEPAKILPKAIKSPSIKGVRLGDSAASLRAKYSNTFCPGGQEKENTDCIVNGISYVTAEGMMVVSFVQSKAVSITIRNIDPSNFGTVSSALTAKMGESNDTYVQLLGEPPGSLAWGGDNWFMVAVRNLDEGKSGVLLIDRAYMEKRLAEHKEKAEGDL